MRLLYFIILLFFSLPVSASDKPDLDSFGQWPVLHDGRIKTMESFSRSIMYTLSKKTEVDDVDSLTWMVSTLFDPASTITTPFIQINKQTILDLPERPSKYYSMNEVMAALNSHQDLIVTLEQRDPSMLSAPQKELLTTYRSVTFYNQIIQSFSAVLPLHNAEKSYVEGGGTKSQRALIAEGGRSNNLLKFIPNDNPSMPLIALWQAIHQNLETAFVNDLKLMAIAWNEGDYKTWNNLSVKIRDELQSQNQTSFRLVLEHYYVTIQPMTWVIIIYTFCGLLLLWKPEMRMFHFIAIGGFGLHVLSLITRSIILSRPPTGTLYETLLFGSAIIMMIGLVLLWRRKNQQLFLSLCALSSAFLLFVSRGFVQGDSLNVLVAVLNTNFWLSTHVTCIIIGYAFCIMAAMVAHGVLFLRAPSLEKIMIPLTLAALLFTSVGTLLGGIWADQSWGRFWGWDPKENGALVIVLWLVWILHGRISGHFKPQGFAAALGLTNIMVALTWFGVNLLGVGLHSYGFISGIAWGLGSFILIQLCVIAWLYYHYPKVKNHA